MHVSDYYIIAHDLCNAQSFLRRSGRAMCVSVYKSAITSRYGVCKPEKTTAPGCYQTTGDHLDTYSTPPMVMEAFF